MKLSPPQLLSSIAIYELNHHLPSKLKGFIPQILSVKNNEIDCRIFPKKNEHSGDNSIINCKKLEAEHLYNNLEQSVQYVDNLTFIANVSKIARAVFNENKKFKSINKCSKKRTPEEHLYALKTWRDLDSYLRTGKIEDHNIRLMKLVKLSLGNCGEQSDVVYALLHKYGFNPEIVIYETPDRAFDHQVCRVNIDGEEYIVDPWSNTICRQDNYILQLENKLLEWEKGNKMVVSNENYLHEFYEDKLSDDHRVRPSEVHKLNIVNSGHPNGENNIVKSNFFDLISEVLSR